MKSQMLESLEEQMRAAQGHLVRRRLAKLDRRFHPPREEVCRWAQLAWRAGLPEQGLNWLYRYVRPSHRKPVNATPAERLEYAGCLIRWGALREADQTLNGIEANSPLAIAAQTVLYKAYAKINAWEYGAAIPLLKAYLSHSLEALYPRVVAEVNLISALSFEQEYNEAVARLDQVLPLCQQHGFHFAAAKLHQIYAEIYIATKAFGEAKRALDSADALLADKQSLDSLFLRKFRVALLAYSAPRSRSTLKALYELTSEATRRKHWETIRDMDRIHAFALGNDDKLRHLYFGTPYASYRRILNLDGRSTHFAEERYLWKLGPNSPKTTLELRSLQASHRREPIMKVGMASHRLLTALSADFYRPQSTAAIFTTLFEGERYVPLHSASRTRKAISRLRSELRDLRLPLRIIESDGTYALGSPSGIILVVEGQSPPLQSRDEGLIDELTRRFRSAPSFDASAVARKLSISPRRAQLLLKSAEAQQRVERLPGRGKFRLGALPGRTRNAA